MEEVPLQPRIEERRNAPTDDVLGMLVRARDDQGRTLSDEQLIAHTNILLVAGHETSTSLSAWLLYLLAQHPDYNQRVLAEQDMLLAPNSLVGFGGGPRICIGVNFAKVEIKALVSHILRHYWLEVAPDQQIVQYYRGTGMPLNGIKMRVEQR